MDIKELTTGEEVRSLFSGNPPNHRPLGKFYFTEDDGKFYGVDNTKGHAWMEGFDSLDQCITWLNSERTYAQITAERKSQLKELYKDHISPENMDTLISIATAYSGTLVANAVQDAYWLLIYGDEPYGPNGKREAN